MIGLINRSRTSVSGAGAELARAFFTYHELLYRVCPGDSSMPEHFSIDSTPKRNFRCPQLLRRHYDEFKGNAAEWFRDWLAIGRDKFSHTDGCWTAIDGKHICSATPRHARMILSIPVALIIEVESNQAEGDSPSLWNFPPSLYPGARARAADGLVYDIVGRAIFDPPRNHYMSRHMLDGELYTYDDLDDGLARRQKNIKKTEFLCGETLDSRLPSTQRTWAVVYHLRGGLPAQRLFYRHQLQLAQTAHGVIFSDDHLENVPDTTLQISQCELLADNDRPWLSGRSKSTVLDYRRTELKPLPKHSQSSPKAPSPPLEPRPMASPPLKPRRGRKPKKESNPSTDAPQQADSYPFKCRCGISGDGAKLDIEEGIVQCNVCEEWSHLACSKDGRASTLRADEPYTCDWCNDGEGVFLRRAEKQRRKG